MVPIRGRVHAALPEEGVSPVVGMVLILAISILGIVAVTNWGLPAIEQMQGNVETSNALDQFRDLDTTMEHLVSGSAGQTTFKWQPTFNQGAIDVAAETDRWLAAADIPNDLNITWSGVSDTDNILTLRPNVTISSFSMKAWRWDGPTPIELKVNASGCGAQPSSLTGGANTQLYLYTNGTCTAHNLLNTVTSFALYRSGVLVHRAFLVDVGHVHWNSVVGPQGPRHVYASNGGLISGFAGGLTVESPLAVAPPRDFNNSTGVPSTSLFVRFVKYNGTASFSATKGGAEHFSLFLNLVGSYTMGNADNVTSAYIYAWGDLRDGVYTALTAEGAGYKFKQYTDAGTAETYLRHDEGAKPFKFSAIYSLVTVEA